MSKKATITEGTIADLHQLEHNTRRHTPRGLGMITASLQQVGAARSVVCDENGVLLAGNGTVEAAQLAGIERTVVVETDGETLVVVKRVGLSEEQKAQLSVWDNRTSELSEFDPAEIAALAEGGLDMSGMFNDKELADILEVAADNMGAPQLDDLANTYGEPQERDFWPVIKVQVHPDTEKRYTELMAQMPGGDDAERFNALISSVIVP
jgi:ParB-like chromosome segregation protein Spo0J